MARTDITAHRIYKSYKVKTHGRARAKKLAQESAERAKQRGFKGVSVEGILRHGNGHPYEVYAVTYKVKVRTVPYRGRK